MKKIGVCPSCHKDIVVDSSKETQTCPYCGASFSTNQIPLYSDKPAGSSPASQAKPEPERKYGGAAVAALVVLLVVGVAIGAGLFISRALTNTNTDPNTANHITERALQNSDFSASGSQDLTSYTVTVSPTIAIKTFSVALSLYNSKDAVIFSDTQSKSSLSKGSSYSFKFDFGFVNSFSGSYIRCSYSGVVSLL